MGSLPRGGRAAKTKSKTPKSAEPTPIASLINLLRVAHERVGRMPEVAGDAVRAVHTTLDALATMLETWGTVEAARLHAHLGGLRAILDGVPESPPPRRRAPKARVLNPRHEGE
jgi:hypothetical protein